MLDSEKIRSNTETQALSYQYVITRALDKPNCAAASTAHSHGELAGSKTFKYKDKNIGVSNSSKKYC